MWLYHLQAVDRRVELPVSVRCAVFLDLDLIPSNREASELYKEAVARLVNVYQTQGVHIFRFQ